MPIADGDVVTACQAACPTRAIHFGDLNDRDQRRRPRASASPRHYALLDELNTRPRTTYLARVADPAASDKAMSSTGHRCSAAVSPGSAVLGPGWGYASIGDKIADIVLDAAARPALAHRLLARPSPACWSSSRAIGYLLVEGVGIWGINIPVAWGFAIANFVWWIGIGHAGTFISAFLLLLRQKWRTSINRFAEAMTLFAVAMAGLFPLLHLGRPWFFYWLAPYPNMMNLWPQWRSPLVWDFFAIAHLHHRLAAVLVRRPDARPGDAARPRDDALQAHRLRPVRARLARRGAALGAPPDAPTCCSPAWRRRW